MDISKKPTQEESLFVTRDDKRTGWAAIVPSFFQITTVFTVLSLSFVLHQVYGPAFIQALAETKTSFLMMLAFGVWAILQQTYDYFRKSPPSLWQPIKFALSAGLFVPIYPGPLGEKISQVAHMIIWIFT